MKQSPATCSSNSATCTTQIVEHPGRYSFIWLVTVVPGALAFLNILQDITGAFKVTGGLLIDAVMGAIL